MPRCAKPPSAAEENAGESFDSLGPRLSAAAAGDLPTTRKSQRPGMALRTWENERNFAPFREARSFDFRQKFVEMMCWHGKASPCCHSGLGCGFVQLLQDCDDHLAFHIWQVPY